jgi:hypothetical protein
VQVLTYALDVVVGVKHRIFLRLFNADVAPERVALAEGLASLDSG